MRKHKIWPLVILAIVLLFLAEIVYTFIFGSGSLWFIGPGESDIVASIEEKIAPFTSSKSRVTDLTEVAHIDRYHIYLFITNDNRVGSALFLQNKSGEKGYVIQAGVAETSTGEFYFSELGVWGAYSNERALAVFDNAYIDSINQESIITQIVSLSTSKGKEEKIYFSYAYSIEK